MTDTLNAAEVFPPGEYLQDELEARGWSISEFAEILGRPTQAVSEIINGRKLITPETAAEIGRALGTSAEVWLNLQNTYRLRHLSTEPSHLVEVDRRARLRSLVPLAEIRRLGWVPDTDVEGTERAVCNLLGIERISDTPAFAAAARRSDCAAPISPAQCAWLGRIGQLGKEIDVDLYNANLTRTIAERLASSLSDPRMFRGLPVELSKAGVGLVFVRALKGSKIDGAVLRLPNGTPVIGLSLRGNRFDSAVFTLAHELAHICLGHLDNRAALLDDFELEKESKETIEEEANRLAGSWLFPIEPQFAQPISGAAVKAEAQRLRCHPSLIVGRLQWSGQLPWTHLRSLVPKMTDLIDV